MTLQNLTDQTSNTGALVKTTNVFLSLFAVSTLISQTAMDFFSALFVFGVLILAARDSRYRAWQLRRTGLEWFAGLWFGATLLSLLWNTDRVPDLQWMKLLDFRWLLVAVAAGRHLSFIRVSEYTIRAHFVPYVLACLWAISIFFLKYDPLQPGAVLDAFPDGTVRTGGFLQQAIVFAQLYGLWLMIPIGILIQDLPRFEALRSSGPRGTIWMGAVIFGSLAILLSFTRGVWMAVPIASVVILSIRRWTWALVGALLGLVSVVGLMLSWPALNDRILQAFQGGDTERLWIWRANWEMWKDSPLFGVGYNQNVQLLTEYYAKVEAPPGLLVSHAHNQFLHILTGTGVFGMLAYASFWIFSLIAGFRLYRNLSPKQKFARGMTLGVIGAICVFLFGGAFESNFEHAKMRLTLALVLGLLVALRDGLQFGEPKK